MTTLLGEPFGVCVRAHTGETFHPSRASRKAVASPIPVDAPVTTTVRTMHRCFQKWPAIGNRASLRQVGTHRATCPARRSPSRERTWISRFRPTGWARDRRGTTEQPATSAAEPGMYHPAAGASIGRDSADSHAARRFLRKLLGKRKRQGVRHGMSGRRLGRRPGTSIPGRSRGRGSRPRRADGRAWWSVAVDGHGGAPMGTAMAAASAASAGTGGSARRQSSTPRITAATAK